VDKELEKLLASAGLSEEEKKTVEAAFSIEKVGKAVKDGTLAQADYSRKMNELSEERKELQAKWDTANKEYIQMQSDLDATKAEKDAAAAEREAAAQKLKDAETKLADADKNKFDATKFVSVEDFDKRQREIQAGQTAYFGDVLDIVAEHRKLFGQELSPKQLMLDCITAKKTPMEYWGEKYQVQAKRDTIAKEQHDKEITEAVKSGYDKRISEEANPATRQMETSKNPFYTKDAAEGKQPWEDEAPPASETKLLEELQASRA
jgi:hypothetical protein